VPQSVQLLAGERRIRAPCLVVSASSPWRRALSAPWNHALLSRYLDAPVLRAALHPSDLRHRSIEALWRRLLGAAGNREIVTEGDLAAAL
jgi:hypothetical protein